MKKLIISAFLFSYAFSFSQIKALTEDGKEVVLFDNKTWRFVNESDEKTLDENETNENPFTKSNEATFLLKSKRVDAGIYFNPKKWKTIKNDIAPTAEYVFQNTVNQLILGAFITENVPVPTLKSLKEFKISSIEKSADFFRLNKSEYRTVNGVKVLFLDYLANLKGMDFHYISNYYITEDGYASIVVYTFEKQYAESKTELENFINGLVQTEKSTTTEKTYSSPPPPMPTKK